MTKKKTAGIVHATPVAVATATSVQYFPVPEGCTDLGLKLEGRPPMVVGLSSTCPLEVTVGKYIHGLVLPDTEIVYLQDCEHLLQLLAANVNHPRTLIVSSNPYFLDDSACTTTTNVTLYKHTLPVSNDLGVTFQGFPPVVRHVAPTSPLHGKLVGGQTVEALVVPYQGVMNLQSGAFTSSKLLEKLGSTAHVEQRVLIVKDVFKAQREKGSNAAFDDCAIM